MLFIKKSRFLYGFTLITILILIAYAPLFKSGWLFWDDGLLIFQNPLFQYDFYKQLSLIWTTITHQMYTPLTMLSFIIEHSFVQKQPFLYHLDNILLHLFNTFLVMLLIHRLRLNHFVFWLVILIFALSPLQSETVSWIAQRKTLLASFFMLLSLHCYIAYLDLNTLSKNLNKKQNQICYVLFTFLFFIAALLSKPSAIILPALWLITQNALNHAYKPKHLVFAGLSFLLVLPIAFLSFKYRISTSMLPLDERIISFLFSLSFYPFHFLKPWEASPIYHPPSFLFNSDFIFTLIKITLLSILTIIFQRHSMYRFALFWYLIQSLPLLALNHRYEHLYLADHHMYLSSIGFALLISMSFDNLVNRFKPAHRKLIYLLFSIPLTVFFVFKTHQSALSFKDEKSFWTSINNKKPYYLAYIHLGHLYRKNNQLDQAKHMYEQAEKLEPPNDALSRNYLASLKIQLHDFNGALLDYHLAIKRNPQSAMLFLNRGSLYDQLGQYDLALQDYNHAIYLNKHFAQALYLRSLIYCRLNDIAKALADLEVALKEIPHFPSALKVYHQLLASKTTQHLSLDIPTQEEDGEIWDIEQYENSLNNPQRYVGINNRKN